VSYRILKASSFNNSAKKVLRKHPNLKEEIQQRVAILREDPSHPKLKTHKLRGELKDFWSFSIEYDLRVLFQYIEHEGEKAILLCTIGSHDEVY